MPIIATRRDLRASVRVFHPAAYLSELALSLQGECRPTHTASSGSHATAPTRFSKRGYTPQPPPNPEPEPDRPAELSTRPNLRPPPSPPFRSSHSADLVLPGWPVVGTPSPAHRQRQQRPARRLLGLLEREQQFQDGQRRARHGILQRNVKPIPPVRHRHFRFVRLAAARTDPE